MRLTSVLNAGLMGLVVATLEAGVTTWRGLSGLEEQLEAIRHVSHVNKLNSDLGEPLRRYLRWPESRLEESVRERLDAARQAIASLSSANGHDDTIARLDDAVARYHREFDVYVERAGLKAEALARVDKAARALRNTASEEALLIERVNAAAAGQTGEAERRRAAALRSALHATDFLTVLHRLDQATHGFIRRRDATGRNASLAALERLGGVLERIVADDHEMAADPRLTTLHRWLQSYRLLLERVAAGSGAGPGRLQRALSMLRVEAERLETVLQNRLRNAIREATQKPDLVLNLPQSLDLIRMRHALREVLDLVAALKDPAARAESLAEEMRLALGRLREDTKMLYALNGSDGSVIPIRRPAVQKGVAQGAATIDAALISFERAWQAAVDAADKQELRAAGILEAAAHADAAVSAETGQLAITATEQLKAFRLAISVIIAVCILLVALGAVYVYRNVTQPLVLLSAAVARLAKGELAVPVPRFHGGRELRELAEAAEVFRQSSLERIALERENARKEHRLARERAEAEKLEITLRSEQEKMLLQRKFVSLVSHEFRTPLAIIDGHARGMLKRLARMPVDAVEEKLKKITIMVERLIGLMESVLASSRLEAGTIAFAPEEHDLRALVEEVCSHQNDISKATHRIHASLDALPRNHRSDPRLLRQVFANLLSNAVKYSPGASRVDVVACREGAGFAIEVRDYGLGIPEDELPRLGTQFFRASTATGIAGTGIGLNLVKAFVEMHGGRLRITSKPGEGSVFDLYLPETI